MQFFRYGKLKLQHIFKILYSNALTLLAIIIFGLLLGAASPRKNKPTVTKSETSEPLPRDRNAATSGVLFYILLIFMLGVII